MSPKRCPDSDDTDVTQRVLGFRGGVSDVLQTTSGLRSVLVLRKGCPDSNNVSPITKRGPAKEEPVKGHDMCAPT